MRRVFLALFAVALIGLAPNTWPFVGNPNGAGPVTTATPQVTMNPFNVVMGDQAAQIPDMGATPDNFVLQADWNQESTNTGNTNYCGTTAAPNCVTYKYVDQVKNHCTSTLHQIISVLTDAGLPATFAPGTAAPSGAESWFTHQYPANPVPTAPGTPFRGISVTTGAACAPYYVNPLPTTLSPPITSHMFQMNMSDANFRAEVANCCWNTASPFNYPQTQNATTPPYMIYEDDSGIMGNGITGGAGSGQPFSTEFGCGFNGGQTCRIDQQGSGTDTPGPFAVTDAYTVGLGKWASSACGSPCFKMRFNGGSPIAGQIIGCNIFHGTNHCNDKSITGYIDNTYEDAINSVVKANSAGNIKGFDMESPIYDHKINKWGTAAELSAVLNTWIQFQADASNNGIYLTDLEPGWGATGTPVGAGNLATDVRLMSIAMEWMTPDYNGVGTSNDRIIPLRLPIGLTATEAPSFFELFLVPFAPKQTESTYVYNNTRTITIGSGCASGAINNQGDSGGITDATSSNKILMACATGDQGGVYRIEYNQVWFNSHNYGPMWVAVNTSNTDTFTIQNSWFALQPKASYGFALSLAAGEMQSVAQGNIGGGVATFTSCSNVTYCLGSNNTMANNTTSTIPTTIGPHSAVILVTTNS